jgi:hypothetical protein
MRNLPARIEMSPGDEPSSSGKIVAGAPSAGLLRRGSLVFGPRRPPRARRLRTPEAEALPATSRILWRGGTVAFR